MQFGSTGLVQLFQAFGETDSFELNPAVRHATGGSCVDEDGCDYEKATLCAFQGASTAKQVAFLACMDEARGSSALSSTQTCATQGGLDYSAIHTCFSGSQGTELLTSAAAVFNKQFPSSTTVPHTFVNSEDVSPSYSTIKNALCADGSTASVCSSNTTAATKPCTV